MRLLVIDLCRSLLVPLCSVLLPLVASAQDVKWRYDYAGARREAAEKERPLIIDFGTESCYWCKQLDLRTFRDPAIISLLNEQFIPLKLDGEREAELASKLRIQNYPTIVLATPEGKIIGMLEGFQEAPRLQDQLQRSLANVAPPEWMTRDYQEASRAVGASEYARALGLLKNMLQDRKDRPIQVKARQLLQEVEQQAASRLARTRQLAEQGQVAEAAIAATELVLAFPETQSASEADQLLASMPNKSEANNGQRVRRARELLAQARSDFSTQQFLCCLDRCELLAAQYHDLPEATHAIELAAEIKKNPEWLRQACETLTDRLGLLYLSLAEASLKTGQPNQAVVYLERVIQTFPGTRQAESAQVRLFQIQGQPSRPLE